MRHRENLVSCRHSFCSRTSSAWRGRECSIINSRNLKGLCKCFVGSSFVLARLASEKVDARACFEEASAWMTVTQLLAPSGPSGSARSVRPPRGRAAVRLSVPPPVHQICLSTDSSFDLVPVLSASPEEAAAANCLIAHCLCMHKQWFGEAARLGWSWGTLSANALIAR